MISKVRLLERHGSSLRLWNGLERKRVGIVKEGIIGKSAGADSWRRGSGRQGAISEGIVGVQTEGGLRRGLRD